jgi:Mn-dependent DtxR family transcriptional regulator
MRSRNGPWRRSQIATELDVHPVRAGQALRELCEIGQVERIGRGRYMLAEHLT